MLLSSRASDKLLMLIVYLPYDNNSFESLLNFRQVLGEISAINYTRQ